MTKKTIAFSDYLSLFLLNPKSIIRWRITSYNSLKRRPVYGCAIKWHSILGRAKVLQRLINLFIHARPNHSQMVKATEADTKNT